MAEYCAADTRRLKSMVLALATDPTWAAEVIKAHAREDWVAAVWPLLPEGVPIDDPDLEPIWAAADEADLPIMYHAFTIETPYFPGYRDVWDNPAMGRCAGQTWGGQRFLSFMLMGGMLDRYPRLRVAALEAGHGWLPHWLVRLTRQIDYVRGSVSPTLEHTPVEYARQGRVFLSIDFSEGPGLTKAAIDVLGDHAFMFASDYPHPETIFPDHADTVIAWRETLGEAGDSEAHVGERRPVFPAHVDALVRRPMGDRRAAGQRHLPSRVLVPRAGGARTPRDAHRAMEGA